MESQGGDTVAPGLSSSWLVSATFLSRVRTLDCHSVSSDVRHGSACGQAASRLSRHDPQPASRLPPLGLRSLLSGPRLRETFPDAVAVT